MVSLQGKTGFLVPKQCLSVLKRCLSLRSVGFKLGIMGAFVKVRTLLPLRLDRVRLHDSAHLLNDTTWVWQAATSALLEFPDVNAYIVRHCLCLVFPLLSWLRQRLSLFFHWLRADCLPPGFLLRHRCKRR